MTASRISAAAALTLLALCQGKAFGWEPDSQAVKTAVAAGGLSAYSGSVAAWLNRSVPDNPAAISEASVRAMLKNRAFSLAVDQHRLLAKAGAERLGEFAKAGAANAGFLSAFLASADSLDLFLEGGEPRDKDYMGALGVLRDIQAADPDAQDGMWRRLAVATALAHAKPANAFGGGRIDPLRRYQHFKAAQKNGELVPMFDELAVWEYAKVVGSQASDSDLAWARELLRTMRPELVRQAQFIQMAREVKYGKAEWGPEPHTFASVLNGGGACGPRAWFGRMVNEAFGVPVWGVKQPGHAAVGFLGNEGWKVMLGRGWDKSTWDHMNGNQFLEIVHARERAEDFSAAEHAKWLADALASKELANAVRGAAAQIMKNPQGPKTVHKLAPRKYPPPQPDKPWQPVAGVQHIVATEWLKAEKASRVPSFDSGSQAYFQKNQDAWVEYKVSLPKAETYGITLGHAVANDRCRVRIYAGDTKVGWMPLNNTKGLWGRTKEFDFRLPPTETLRLVFPAQRGVALKWIEIKAKGDAPAGASEPEPASEAKEEATDPRNPEPAV